MTGEVENRPVPGGTPEEDPQEAPLAKKVTCVFVHGWAMNGSVWDTVIEDLPSWMDVIQVDLPGHGSMNQVELDSLDGMVRILAALVHRPVIWVGWSLGGLAVMRLCELYPERVSRAMLVSTNPCFVARPGSGREPGPAWPHGVEGAVFDQFAADLEQDQEKTIRRFLALQVKGQAGAMQTVRRLQQSMKQRGDADMATLRSGLEILKTVDMRDQLAAFPAIMTSSIHWVLGDRDTLVPATLAKVLAEDFGQQHVSLYRHAGHAPFLSDPVRFVTQLSEMADGVRGS